MLTPHGNYGRYKMHPLAYFCELQHNQRVLKWFLKILRFKTALLTNEITMKYVFLLILKYFSGAGI